MAVQEYPELCGLSAFPRVRNMSIFGVAMLSYEVAFSITASAVACPRRITHVPAPGNLESHVFVCHEDEGGMKSDLVEKAGRVDARRGRDLITECSTVYGQCGCVHIMASSMSAT